MSAANPQVYLDRPMETSHRAIEFALDPNGFSGTPVGVAIPLINLDRPLKSFLDALLGLEAKSERASGVAIPLIDLLISPFDSFETVHRTVSRNNPELRTAKAVHSD